MRPGSGSVTFIIARRLSTHSRALPFYAKCRRVPFEVGEYISTRTFNCFAHPSEHISRIAFDRAPTAGPSSLSADVLNDRLVSLNGNALFGLMMYDDTVGKPLFTLNTLLYSAFLVPLFLAGSFFCYLFTFVGFGDTAFRSDFSLGSLEVVGPLSKPMMPQFVLGRGSHNDRVVCTNCLNLSNSDSQGIQCADEDMIARGQQTPRSC